jgi:hypothetical protein
MVLESTGAIGDVDALDVPKRLAALLELSDGWLQGSCLAPSPDGLSWFSQAFSSSYAKDLQLPHVCPTPEGGVRLEWLLAADVSLDVDLKFRLATWHLLEPRTDAEEERLLNLAEPSGWEWFTARLRELSGEVL